MLLTLYRMLSTPHGRRLIGDADVAANGLSLSRNGTKLLSSL
uniref:Uncharacterized protein n=1 Tax=Peronospora matthiolae TaxID=2874970 RepID=A0AAV1TQX0_9STRA